MNHFSSNNMRSRRNLLDLNGFAPIHFPMYYSTDARTKSDMNHSYESSLFNLHLIPDPLKKNLADSVITGEEDKKMPETKKYMEVKPPNQREYYPSFPRIASFISGVFNVMGAILKRPSTPPPKYYDCFEEYDSDQMAPPSWPSSNIEVLNKSQSESVYCNDSYKNLDSGMSVDCKLAATQCEEKLNQVRSLLSNKNVQNNNIQSTKFQPKRPKKVFVEPSSVEDSFEDAFSPEDFVNISKDLNIELYSPFLNHDEVFMEADAPKILTEIKESIDIIKDIDESESVKDNERTSVTEDVKDSERTVVTNAEVVSSCEDKLNKLKALLSKRCMKQDTQPIPIPELQSELLQTPNNSDESDCFNEIKGKFFPSSVESDDSFQIVFSDGPCDVRRRLPSDCESEDSFIFFEESPDSCYSSNDVFGEDQLDESDSDNEDSGYTCKLSPYLSRTFGDLTDNSLYSQDEVDSVSVCEKIDNEEPRVVTGKTGLLVDDQRKLEKKKLPPKKVHFSSQPPKVHVMRVWAFAARQARAGHWERHALDRERFKRRIADVEMAISWVLKPQHRARIVFQRFRPWWNAQRRKQLEEKQEEKKKIEETGKTSLVVETVYDNVVEVDINKGDDSKNEVIENVIEKLFNERDQLIIKSENDFEKCKDLPKNDYPRQLRI